MDILTAGHDLISILVADSSQTHSELLSAALRRLPGFQVTSCPAELADCLRVIERQSVHVVLLRGGFPGDGDSRGRYEVLRALHASFPGVGLILLLDSYDRDLVVNALRSGARGLFCLAQEPFKALCRCISSVHKGQIWANTEQLKYVIDALTVSPALHVINAKGEDLLTPREQQVVGLVAEGISNREIARQLAITENTVKKSLLRIYDKLGVSNRVELVLYALSHQQSCSVPRGVVAGNNDKPRLGPVRRPGVSREDTHSEPLQPAVPDDKLVVLV